MLRVVCLIDPLQRVHKPALISSLAVRVIEIRETSHAVQSRRDIPHQAHEEERDLQDGICQEFHPAHQRVIPCHAIKVDEEAQGP